MTKVLQGNLNATGKKFGLVASRFNEFITGRLIDGAVDALVRHGAEESDIEIAWVPGAFEIPVLTQKMAQSGKYDAVVALGCVIKGDTPHFDFVAGEVSKGVAAVGLASSVPVIFGVLTTDTIEQAIERAGTKSGNKGADAAAAAIEMADLYRRLG